MKTKECQHCHKQTDHRVQIFPSDRLEYSELWCLMCFLREGLSKFFSCSTYGSYPDDLPMERNPKINPNEVK